MLYKAFYDLFLEGELMSTQMRICLTICILINIFIPNNIFLPIISVFYPILILSFWVPTIGLILHYLGIRKSHKEVINKTNLTKYSYKVVLIIYLLVFMNVKVNSTTLLSTFIYTILYYISFDSEKIYEMNFKESAALVILSSVTVYITQILI